MNRGWGTGVWSQSTTRREVYRDSKGRRSKSSSALQGLIEHRPHHGNDHEVPMRLRVPPEKVRAEPAGSDRKLLTLAIFLVTRQTRCFVHHSMSRHNMKIISCHAFLKRPKEVQMKLSPRNPGTPERERLGNAISCSRRDP